MIRKNNKFKLVIEFEGTRYCGWQFQPNGLSVQEVLESSLKKITKEKTTVLAAGRTDSGVHAEAMVAHFWTDSRMDSHQFLKALNSLLPHDIVVQQVQAVSHDFNARKSATWKIYRYTILNRDYPSALHFRQSHYVATPLNLTAMRRAAKHFIGVHDFTAFRAVDCGSKISIREITRLTISKQGDWIRISVKGSGFLKYMVRIIVGTLIDVGHGKLAPDRIVEILKSKDRIQAGPTAPARGLCLVKVGYGKRKIGVKKTGKG